MKALCGNKLDVAVQPGRERDSIACAARAAALATIAFLGVAFVVLRPPIPPGPLMRDFEPQYAAGGAFTAGRDPYSTDVWQIERRIPGVDPGHEELLPFVGAPLFLPLLGGVARVPYLVAAVPWALLIGASTVAILLGSFALVGGRLDRGNLVSLGALCVGFTPLISGISLGQEALPAFAGVIAALWSRRRSGLPTTAASLLCAFKPTFAALLLPLVVRDRWAKPLIGAAAFTVGASLAALGPAGMGRYLVALRGQNGAERFDVIQFTPFAVAYDFGLSPQRAALAGAVLALGVLVLFGWVLAVRRRGSLETVALAAAAFPLVCPFLHLHDLIVALLPGFLCLLRTRGAAWLGAACGLLLIAGGWFGFSQGVMGLGFTLGLFVVAVFAIIALSGRHVGAVRLAPLGLVPIAFAYGWFAIAHPIVFWPAGLAHGFAVAGHPTAATVWAAEQRRNGLDRPDVWWASLRAVSLGGSLLLFGTTLRVLWPSAVAARVPKMRRHVSPWRHASEMAASE